MAQEVCNNGYCIVTKPLPSGQFHITLTISWPAGSRSSRTVCPVAPHTNGTIQNTYGAQIRHLPTPWGRNVFLTILSLCCRGFVMDNLSWLFELNSLILQGTKVLEDREIRHSFHCTWEDTPPQHISVRIAKYTGALAAPQWEDVEEGRVFNSPWYLVKALRARQTSSKRCAMSRPTSPPLRIHQTS